MRDESVKRLIKFLATTARMAHREAKKWEKTGWAYGFNRGKMLAYLLAARIIRDFQKLDEMRDEAKTVYAGTNIPVEKD